MPSSHAAAMCPQAARHSSAYRSVSAPLTASKLVLPLTFPHFRLSCLTSKWSFTNVALRRANFLEQHSPPSRWTNTADRQTYATSDFYDVQVLGATCA